MYKEFIEKISRHKNIAVFSHVRPDGDCLGSQVAFCLWCRKNGIKATAFNEDGPADNLAWLQEFYPIEQPSFERLTEFDAFVILDGNALHRFGTVAESIVDLGKPIYMIDHHPQPDDIFEVGISRPDYSSTAELIYELYAEHDINQIDTPAAKAMYVGIVTDTGSYQFDSVTPNTLNAGAELLKRGEFKPNEVVEKVYATKTINQLHLLSKALDTITLHANQQIASICVTKAMFEATATQKEDTEGFVSYPLSISGVKACILFREDDDRIKISLRSRSEVDVNKWARQINGGGHKKAAAGWHTGPLEKAIEEVVAIGEQQLK
ncbi:MAG: bifunctional oligoribonuclease/PAP phosphatase NrnA [Balneolaceae bacterium]|nr:bifunctional oligoribonuclease/PAP phosphatase NrnA [Balneolaceae bacterium]